MRNLLVQRAVVLADALLGSFDDTLLRFAAVNACETYPWVTLLCAAATFVNPTAGSAPAHLLLLTESASSWITSRNSSRPTSINSRRDVFSSSAGDIRGCRHSQAASKNE